MSEGDPGNEREGLPEWVSRMFTAFFDTHGDETTPEHGRLEPADRAADRPPGADAPAASGAGASATSLQPEEPMPEVHGSTLEGARSSSNAPAAAMVIPECGQCVHLREPRSLVKLVFDALPPLARARTAARLPELNREERQSAATEREEYAEYRDGDVERWSSRPIRHSYCGFREFRGEWYVHEVKNRDGKCPPSDFSERTLAPPSATCDTCEHLQPPRVDLLVLLEACLLTGGNEGKAIFAERVKPEVEVWAELDLTEAIAEGGVVPSEPRFLPICRAYSEPARYVVGPVVNTANLCKGWSPRTSSGSGPLGAAIEGLWNAVLRSGEVVAESYATKLERYGTDDAVELVKFVDIERESFQRARAEFVAAALAELGFGTSEVGSIVLSAQMAFVNSDKVDSLKLPSTSYREFKPRS
jgi:hypothetical protein